uniref:Uncharacterized protein n=1 Tax=Timema monikensis TaxID=170555 RepID=A0A7R9ECR3_9NEOP|nr:unnamed protein product [Timema monikensis]
MHFWPRASSLINKCVMMKAVLFFMLLIAGLVTLSCAHHCNTVCAATLCLRITSEDCVKEGGVFNPSNPNLEVHPCICCDSCTINRKPALREQQCSLYLAVPPSSPPPSYVRMRTTVKHHVADTMKAVLFSVLFIAGLVTLSCADHCYFVCPQTQCENVTMEMCIDQGGQFKPKNSDLNIHPCVCCDTCIGN